MTSMKKQVDKIQFGWIGSQVIIRVIGTGNFRNSRYLKEAAYELLRERYKDIIIDLAECTSMDSTFLGVLIGLTLKMKKDIGRPISLVNINKTVYDVLKTLGTLNSFDVVDQPASFDTTFESIEAAADEHDEAIHKIRHVLEAHENLMEINDENKERFKFVKQALEDDLKNKLKQQEKGDRS